MSFKLFSIFVLFMVNITIHSFVENSHIKIPDFRYTKTMCTNELNNLQHVDVILVPNMDHMICWIFQNDVRFSKPYLPYEIIVFFDIFVFMVGLFFI
jgi:hypothetical protein